MRLPERTPDQEATSTTVDQTPPGRFGVYSLVIVLFLALSAALFWGVKHSRPPLYRRYTSPPLNDGTRYTLLYPAYLQKVHPSWFKGGDIIDSVRIDQGSWTPNTWDRLRYFLHLPSGQPMDSSITIIVGRIKGAYPFGTRRDTRWVTGDTSHSELSIVDMSAHRRFLLLYDDRYHPGLFLRDDPVVIRSFRILPPGTR